MSITLEQKGEKHLLIVVLTLDMVAYSSRTGISTLLRRKLLGLLHHAEGCTF